MTGAMRLTLHALLLVVCCSLPAAAASGAPAAVDFERDVRPIFESRCYECHGPAKQKGQLRLDSREIAFKGGTSEHPAVAPGDTSKSYLLQRILGEADEERMPLKRDPLTPQQIATIKAWIEQGAKWPEDLSVKDAKINVHWSFVKPARPNVPAVKDKAWLRNAIDAFVLARLEKEGLKPSPEADRVTLIRRLSLDLIGLPPTVGEVDAFVSDKSPDAYERLVDRLLASPHYGERWGRVWLDVARYADTNGYEKDRNRTIWPYRDWVIDALNRDLPFDRFTLDQLAGDMLPNHTPQQIVATGFHRNTMTNEEGGIDVEEFRVKNVVDRVHTTATAWLGLTMQCAQCHNHKYDPVSQREYYGFFAMMNNADEPYEYKIPDPQTAAKRAEIERQIAQLESELESRFPAGEEKVEWTVLHPTEMKAQSGATLTKGADGSVLASGTLAPTDSYTVTFKTDLTDITSLRLETLTDPSLTRNGPGRNGADNGNYVITEISVSAAPAKGGDAKPVALASAEADVNQPNFDVSGAIDGNPATGWAVDVGGGKLNTDHAATIRVKEPINHPGGAVLTVTIGQGLANHSLGKFRVSAGRATSVEAPGASLASRRAERLQQKLTEWEKAAAAKAGRWTAVRPTKLTSHKGATMEVLDDASVLVSGDWPNNDTYDVELETDLKGITAVRLEVLPHESHPDGGPGRAPLFSVGDFLLSEVELSSSASPLQRGRQQPWQPVKISKASHSAASGGKSAAAALDGKTDTGWSVGASTAKPAKAVFVTEAPVTAGADGKTRLMLTLVQQYIHQMTIGRFRVWVTTDAKPADAADLPPDVEQILVTAAEKRTPAQRDVLKRHFLSITPELAPVHQQIASLRQLMPKFQTTLAMQERKPQHTRVTRRYHRGEFLHPREPVAAAVPKVLHPLPKGAKADRLGLARWLVADDNPLTARVTVNRAWTTIFGRGIVSTVEDWGTMGERPSHPELLDWLATELQFKQKWSQKGLHRLIVTSATYRQSSNVSPELLKRDPANVLLARGPRFRVEAETVRDAALVASGLLDRKIGGPSVYPPQPDGVNELSWGGGAWPTSTGGDRFRRGLYTFLKRTSPYPGMTIFDGTTADVTCMRRLRSNTPLQALTLMNDQVFVEASQALARRVVTEGPADVIGRARLVFRLCTSREPDALELDRVVAFHGRQLARFASKNADAAAVAVSEAVPPPPGADLNDLAAWTTVARALLNLDETVTKE